MGARNRNVCSFRAVVACGADHRGFSTLEAVVASWANLDLLCGVCRVCGTEPSGRARPAVTRAGGTINKVIRASGTSDRSNTYSTARAVIVPAFRLRRALCAADSITNVPCGAVLTEGRAIFILVLIVAWSHGCSIGRAIVPGLANIDVSFHTTSWAVVASLTRVRRVALASWIRTVVTLLAGGAVRWVILILIWLVGSCWAGSGTVGTLRAYVTARADITVTRASACGAVVARRTLNIRSGEQASSAAPPCSARNHFRRTLRAVVSSHARVLSGRGRFACAVVPCRALHRICDISQGSGC